MLTLEIESVVWKGRPLVWDETYSDIEREVNEEIDDPKEY